MSLINIKQINNRSSSGGSVIAYNGDKNVWMKIHHHQVISFSDLIAGKIVIEHDMLRKYVQVSIYDQTDRMIIPDEIRLIDQNSFEIDLTSYGTNIINWNVVVA